MGQVDGMPTEQVMLIWRGARCSEDYAFLLLEIKSDSTVEHSIHIATSNLARSDVGLRLNRSRLHQHSISSTTLNCVLYIS
jgi:hypothetical protein